ncbi:hypothetical protein NHX12_019830, partial [Muraenolepis orangiensis]
MHYPNMRDEELRVIENTIRLAVDSIINVLASVDCARTREHERTLAEREREIRRLTDRGRRFEREVKALRKRRGGYDTGGGHTTGEHRPPPVDPEGSDPWPGWEEEEEEDGEEEDEDEDPPGPPPPPCFPPMMSFSLSLLQSPSSPTRNQVPAAPSPAIQPALQQTVVSHTPEAVDGLEVRQVLVDVPVIKEEPSDMDAVCESSDFHTPVHGGEHFFSVDSGDKGLPGNNEYHPSSPGNENPKMSTNQNWHYNFKIPWDKMSVHIKKKLKAGVRPSTSERRMVIRVIVSDLLATCKTTGKKHVLEIARRVIRTYPKSFRDEIGGEVVGSGYDSIVRQMLSSIYNVRRTDHFSRRRLTLTTMTKHRQRHSYGCINPEPQLPAGETQDTQNRKTDELKLMFKNRDKDMTKMEVLMMETFASQRKDMLSAQKNTKTLLEKWPYLFHVTGMRIHFRELTGILISERFEDTTARRILEFFHFLPIGPSSRLGDLVVQTTREGCDSSCGAVLLLLAHFNDQQERMFVQVDHATAASEVDTTTLPWNPCIVVC